jgi:hypothetical protein
MSRIARLVPFLAALAAAAAVAAAPASADATTGTYCDLEPNGWVYTLADGSTVFGNEASGGGCAFVRSYPAGYLRLDHVILAAGWTYVVKKNGEGTSSRVELQFTETATGRKVDFRVEYGTTKIG